ncbi:MAG TPA: carboxypeptidase-like regulatory domain-containing protein [Pirellulales bacterium]
MAKDDRTTVHRFTWLFICVGAFLTAMLFTRPAGADDDAAADAQADPDDPEFAGRFRGRVTDQDGNPLRGARIVIVAIDSKFNTLPTAIGDALRVRAVTGEDGRFAFDAPDMTYLDVDGLRARRAGLMSATADGYGPDWIFVKDRSQSFGRTPAVRIKRNHFTFELAKDDVPIQARLLNPDGSPLSGARVRLINLIVPRHRNLDEHLRREATASPAGSPAAVERHLYFRPHQIPGLTAETATDADGRFTMSGFGRDRIVSLDVSAPAVVDTSLFVMTRDAPAVGIRRGAHGVATGVIHGAGFVLELKRGRTISGVVRDRDSHEPIVGIWVGIGSRNSWPSRTKDECYPRDGVLTHQTVTDAQGRFSVTGLMFTPDKQPVTAASAPGMDYQSASLFAAGDAPVLIECQRGIPFRLKLVDEQGQPVDAEVTYDDVVPNPHAPRGFCYPCRRPLSSAGRNADGTYQGFVLPGPGAIFVQTSGRDDLRAAGVDPKTFFAPGRLDWTERERIGFYGTHDTLYTSCGWHFQDDYAAIVLVNPAPNSGPLELTATVVADKPRSGRLIDADGKPVTGVSTRGATLDQYDYEPPLRAASFLLTKLHPDRFRRVTFIQEERQLIGFLAARGDGDAAYTVRMSRWATVTGRIVDENGKPLPIGKQGGPWGQPPTLSMSEQAPLVQPDPNAGEHADVTIDPEGRFRIDHLVPGLRYEAKILRDAKARQFAGMAFIGLVLLPGEVRDLGDIRVRPTAEVALSIERRPTRGQYARAQCKY